MTNLQNPLISSGFFQGDNDIQELLHYICHTLIRQSLRPETRSHPGNAPGEPVIAPASNEAGLALKIIQVPHDLAVNLRGDEPMLANPVAMDVDEKGRVFVSETHRYRSSTLDIRHYYDMPEIYARTLSRTDLRDLIAFPGSLVEDPEKRNDDIEEY